jgi:pyruvate,water dikinase
MQSPLIVPLSSREACDASRFGPKAANLAKLGRAGLPIPTGFCLDAEGYRIQVRRLGLERDARGVFSAKEGPQARQHALQMKLGLLDKPITAEVLEPLLAAWEKLKTETGAMTVVRSSALVEDRYGSSFAGQFESYLGLETEAEFITAVRSCWGALWATRALRYMATHDIDPGETAMGVLVQPLVSAKASGGGLSNVQGDMILSATWGLGSAIAQGEVTPDRYVVSRKGKLLDLTVGRKDHQVGCEHHVDRESSYDIETELVSAERSALACLTPQQAEEMGGLLLKVEALMGLPVEIEWAMDEAGFKLVQGRPLHTQPSAVPDEIWKNQTRLKGHAAGVGWGTGRACVINCECEMGRIAPGDILVTKVAGPALSQILTQVAGVVAERGGSTSHMASLARERGIPMVLGVLDATRRIPNGSTVAVDGVAGVVRWMQ